MTMPEFPETSGIPDESRHWNALAERISASARGSDSGLYWLATARSAWIASSLLVAAGLIASVSPLGKAAGSGSPEQLPAMMAPDDNVGQAIVLGDSPPAIGALLLPERATTTK